MRFNVGSTSDVGLVRTLNEDSLFVGDDLFAVADGMGGHRGGEVASAEALATLRTAFTDRDIDGLVAAARAANQAVFEKAQESPDLSGMGTTLCAIAVVTGDEGPRLGLVNVGDSRVYVYGDGGLKQLSDDHSFVEALVRDGRLTRAQADVHPQRNVLTRALGIEPDVEIDWWELAPRRGDRFLLCSDGLFNEVADDELAAVLAAEADPEVASRELVRRAKESGGRDNITCVVVDIDLDGDAPVASTVAAATDEPADRVVRHSQSSDDLAGFDVDPVDDVEPVPPSGAARNGTAGSPADEPIPHSSRWRTVMFVGAVVATLAIALGAVAWAARDTYFVGLQRGEVVIFQGRPNGLLWFKRTVREHTGIKQGLLDEASFTEISKNKVEPSLAEAKAYVTNLQLLPEVPTSTASTTTTSSTTPSSTTTVAATDPSATSSTAVGTPTTAVAPTASGP